MTRGDEVSDCISREDTLTAFSDYVGSGMSMDDFDALWDIVVKMPSVTLTERTGHWLYKRGELFPNIKCSECGYEPYFSSKEPLYKFCPNCGCRMVEPQESDHKCHTCKHYTSGERDGSCGSYICKHYSGWESEG